MNTSKQNVQYVPRSSKKDTVCSKKQFVDEDKKYPQYEGLYYITYSQTGQKKLKLMNVSDIKWCLLHDRYVYEEYKDSQMNRLIFDFDHFPTIESFRDLVMCFNEIINNSTINEYYQQLSTKAYPIIDIFAYGKYPEEDIAKLYENEDIHENLHIHYEEKADNEVKKSLSSHVVMNCYLLHALLDKTFFNTKDSHYLTNSEHTIWFDIDKSIYKNNGCLRIVSSDKNEEVENVDDEGNTTRTYERVKTGLNITDNDQFMRQFYQYPYKLSDDDKTIYENIFNVVLSEYITDKLRSDNKQQAATRCLNVAKAIDESSDDEDIESETGGKAPSDKQPKHKLKIDDLVDEEVVEAVNEINKGDGTIDEIDFLKPPLGLIAEILTYYPAVHYDEFICQPQNRYWKAFSGFILNCPYTYDEIHDVIHDYWNAKITHNHPNALNDVVYEMMKGRKPKRSNKGYYLLLSIFTLDFTIEQYAESRNFPAEKYEELKAKNKRNLSRNQRNLLFELHDAYAVIKTEYRKLNKFADQLDEYTRIFKVFQTFELKRNDKSLYNIFIDKDTADYIHKGEHDVGNFTKVPIDKIHILYPNPEYSIVDIIKTSFEEYKELKQHYLYSTRDELAKGREIEECLKSTFENEFDYRMWCDFLRFKLNNIKKSYRINFLFVGDNNSLKTTFMDILDEFIDIKKGNAKEMGDKFNAAYESDIVLYEELPTTVNNVKPTVDYLKSQTCAKKITLEKKGRDMRTIKNYSNIVITTNHSNLGGLFDYQEKREMFKRFYIIKRTEATEETIEKLYSLIDNEKYLNAFIHILKHKEPLTPEEWKNRDTQQQFYKFVKDKNLTRRVLNEYEIEASVSKDGRGRLWAKLSTLAKQLNKYNLIINKQTERQQLETDGIIKYYKSNDTCLILDIFRYYKRYFETETNADNTKIKEHIQKAHNVNAEIVEEEEDDEEVETKYKEVEKM